MMFSKLFLLNFIESLKNKIAKDKLLKETFWAFATKALTLTLFFLLNLVLARKLGVNSFGLWSLFLSVITIFYSFSYFGINASTKKTVAQYSGTDNLKNILLSSIKLRFVVSLIFAILLLFSYKFIANLLGNSSLEILFLYAVPLVFLSGFVEYLKAVFIGLHRVKYNFILNSVEFGLKFLLVLLFFVFSQSVLLVIYSFNIALFVTIVVGFCLLYFNFYKDLNFLNKDFIKEILGYSYPLIVISIGFILLTEVDTIMIGYYFSSSEVAIYSVAKQIIIKLPHLALAISMGTMPIFAKLNNSNKQKLKHILIKIIKLTMGIYILIALFLLFFSPIFIPMLFGDEYILSVLPLQILSVFLIFVSMSVILNSFLDYVGKVKIRAYNIVLTILLNIVLNIFLIPQYGVVGAALATTISYLPYTFLNWIESKKILA